MHRKTREAHFGVAQPDSVLKGSSCVKTFPWINILGKYGVVKQHELWTSLAQINTIF